MLEQIEEVSIDLWLPYKNLVKELMPSAEVVADRFHVMKQINQELDEQRRAEKRAVEAQKNKKQKAEKEAKLEVLKRSKYSLLKNEKDLTETQKIKLEAIKETCPNLTKMYELIETSSVSTSQWSKVILSYEGIPEFPAFESYGDELLPPRELDVKYFNLSH